jgi:hypothetical protein
MTVYDSGGQVGVGKVHEQKKLQASKIPEITDESHRPTACFVSFQF